VSPRKCRGSQAVGFSTIDDRALEWGEGRARWCGSRLSPQMDIYTRRPHTQTPNTTQQTNNNHTRSANILAPIYKRLDDNGTRESQFEDRYLARQKRVVDALAPPAAGRRAATTPLPDVICVQVRAQCCWGGWIGEGVVYGVCVCPIHCMSPPEDHPTIQPPTHTPPPPPQEFWIRGEKFKAQYLDRFCNQLGYKFVEVRGELN
jgi:hypothetical protein